MHPQAQVKRQRKTGLANGRGPGRGRRPTWLAALWLGVGLASRAGLAAAAPAAALPTTVEAALQRAKLPPGALSVVVQEVGAAGPGPDRLRWNAQVPVNPASLAKLVTTYAALDLLGPAWSWATPVLVSGPLLPGGVLDGSVTLQGRGDPRLVQERLWLLLRRLQQAGVREIRGDIVLDRSAFAPSARAPGDFDGEPHRPQNVQPDALLLNQATVIYTFWPDAAGGVARIGAEPPLAGVQVDATVPLGAGPCDDWRAALKPQFDLPGRVRFAGTYPAACGERSWPMASAEPAAYGGRLVAQAWAELGGRLGGTVRTGPAPAGSRLLFEHRSPPLAEVVRDINKFSNNVMAEQLFLSLALPAAPTASGAASGPNGAAIAPGAQAQPPSARTTGGASLGTPPVTPPVTPPSAFPGALPPLPAPAQAASPVRPDDARALLQRWLAHRLGDTLAREVVVDNGSGLSRDGRLTAQALAALLQAAWASPVMPELVSSLPVTGTDGTLRRSAAPAGRAHLKTGSLRDVAGLAGYVLSAGGRRLVLVAIVNHPQAAAARPALDALVQWAIEEGGGPPAARGAAP